MDERQGVVSRNICRLSPIVVSLDTLEIAMTIEPSIFYCSQNLLPCVRSGEMFVMVPCQDDGLAP